MATVINVLAAAGVDIADMPGFTGWTPVLTPERLATLDAILRWPRAELLEETIGAPLGPWMRRTIARLAARIIRRAKAERRVYWCPSTQRYEALPAWRHRPLPSRHPWPWPMHASGRR